jgi:predicted DNA-binding antitoxin AbrB/MazE fold protein
MQSPLHSPANPLGAYKRPEAVFFLAIAEDRIIRVEAEMESFTVQAVYEKGVLKPKKKLNLPEHSVVELRVRVARSEKQKTPFASLIGVWEDLPEKEAVALEKSLARACQQPASKVKEFAKP